MGRTIRPIGLCGVFRGSEAVAAGAITAAQLRGPGVKRLFYDVYVTAGLPVTHELRCEGAALALPPAAVITGRSAATLRGASLAWPYDPVELVVPEATHLARRNGLDVRRTEITTGEWEPWCGIGLATPLRMGLDLLLDRSLPDAVADLDAVLRAGQISLPALQQLVDQRHDRGIVCARRAVQLADPRAESPPESRMRVWLVLDGLHPEPKYWVHDDRGRLARVDLAFPEHRLAVEYDGAWRSEPWALNRDRDRLNRVHAAGWDVVFVTAELLRDPPRMIRTVRSALDRTR
ncbi:MAG: endonuclease domain-containing protein [Pseudonocardiaceae bacterium]